MSTSAIPPTGRPTTATDSNGRNAEVPTRPPFRRAAPTVGGDGVVYSGHTRAVRGLVRERVLAATRAALSVHREGMAPAAPVHFAAVRADEDAEAFAGRLRSEQNLLLAAAKAERCTLPSTPAAVRALLDDAAIEGMSEALDILHTVGELTEDVWRTVTTTCNGMVG